MRSKGKLLLILLLVVAAVGLLFRLWMVYRYHYDDLPFDRAVWIEQSGNHDGKNPRGRMADAVIRTELRKGMTRQEVVRLLGEPDASETGSLYEYNIGNWGRCFICDEVLAVHFDTSGRLTSAEVDEH